MAQGDYSRIQHGFWRDPDVKRALSPAQKCLLLYYFSCPGANMIGLYYCPLETAASETGVDVDDVRAWTSGILSPFVSYDATTEEVLIHRGAEHQLGVKQLSEKDKRVKAVVKLLDDARSAWLRRRFWNLHCDWPIGPCPGGPDEAPSMGHTSPLEAPTKPIAVAVAVAVASQPNPETDTMASPSGPSPVGVRTREEDEPPASDVNATLAPLIREHLWRADKPPPPSARDGPWNMGRDLQIASRLMAERGIDLDEMCEIVMNMRAVLRQPNDAPLTLRMLNQNGRRDRLEDVLGYVRKRREKAVAEQGLKRIDQLLESGK